MRKACAALLLQAVLVAAVKNSLDRGDGCHTVVFDQTDASLHVRTLVVENDDRQRVLVLTNDTDLSKPCGLRWWLDHNPQGEVQCTGKSAQPTAAGEACAVSACRVDSSEVELGYVRTMLASVVYAPTSAAHTMSAICIELGCRTRIRRAKVRNTLLQRHSQWLPRAHLKSVLVIGLGSSTMANWFRRALPETALHVVDLVPGVVAAAPCFGLATQGDSRLQLHVGDGRAFLQSRPDGEFDAIVLDAFDSSAALPPCFRTHEFFELAKKKLSVGGALSFNLLANKEAPRVLKSLAANFEGHRVWLGDAPGAQGLQTVVTAFAPGRAATASEDEHKGPIEYARARSWFDDANIRTLPADVLQSVVPLDDATLCNKQGTRSWQGRN